MNVNSEEDRPAFREGGSNPGDASDYSEGASDGKEENNDDLNELITEASSLDRQLQEIMEDGIGKGQSLAEHLCILGARSERLEQVRERIRVAGIVREEEKKRKALGVDEYECAICREELPSLDWFFASFCHICGCHLCIECEDTLKGGPCPSCRQGTMSYIPCDKIAENDKNITNLAAKGHPAGQLVLCVGHQRNMNLPSASHRMTKFPNDDAKAAKYLQLSANQGYTPAQVFLALFKTENTFDLHFHNPYIKKNDGEAVVHLADAAKKGDPSAQMYLATMYERGMGVTKDNAEAFRLCTLAATAGLLTAQNHMAASYQLGRIAEKSPALSKYWAQIAARRGYPDSYVLLGEAIEDVVEAAFQGNISLTGHSVIPQVVQLYRTAYAAGNPFVQRSVMIHINHYESHRSNICDNCNKSQDSFAEPLKRCQRCKCTWYCSKKCQLSSWREGHKVDCCTLDDATRCWTRAHLPKGISFGDEGENRNKLMPAKYRTMMKNAP